MHKFFCVLWILLLVSACSSQPDEVKINAAIKAMHQAIEEKNLGNLMGYIADDFVGKQGQYNKQDIQQLLRGILFVNKKITVVVISGQTEFTDNNRANSTITVLAMGSSQWLPERGRTIDFEVAWKKIDDEWLVYNVVWDQENN